MKRPSPICAAGWISIPVDRSRRRAHRAGYERARRHGAARGRRGGPAARARPASSRGSPPSETPAPRGRDHGRRRRHGGSRRRRAAACRGRACERTITGCASSSCMAGRVRVPNTGRPGSRAGCAPPGTTSSTPSCRPATSRAPTAGGSPSAPSSGASPRARTTSASSWRTRSAACCGCARRPTSRPRGAWTASRSSRPPCPGAAVPELAGFYPTGAEREAVARAARETRLVCTDNDPYCPGRERRSLLGAAARADRRPAARRRPPQRRGRLRPVAGDGGVVPGRGRHAEPAAGDRVGPSDHEPGDRLGPVDLRLGDPCSRACASASSRRPDRRAGRRTAPRCSARPSRAAR